MGRLEYDDNGFTYFGIGLGISFLVPYSLNVLWSTVKTLTGTSGSLKPRTALEAAKAQRDAKDSGVKGVLKKESLKRWAIVILGWLFVAYLFSFTGSETDIEVFDPWKILGLEEGTVTDAATKKSIKSAYRKLSLSYHPDRNRNKEVDEQAKAAMIFERVQKAHDILTKEDAYELFQRTGSPDGSSDMQLSIGLPKFLMDKRNHNLVLVVYLLVLVVIIPIAVGSWYAQSKQFGDRLIMNDSFNIFAHLLDKNTRLEHLPEILALSAEFRTLPERTAKERELLSDLETSMKSEGLMARESCRKVARANMLKRWPACRRANVLIHVYLNRLTQELTPGLRDDLDYVLIKSKMLVEAMNDAIFFTRNVDSMQQILKFEQYLTQALWVKDSPFQQFPHVDKATAKKIGPNFPTFLESSDDVKLDGLTDEQCKDIAVTRKLLPHLEVTTKIGVVEQENPDGTLVFEATACEGDIMTASIQIERLHETGPVHAPYFPTPKEEQWTVLFCQKGQKNILALTKLSGPKQVLRTKIQFPSRNFLKPGEHFFDFYVVSTSYLGCDLLEKGSVKLEKEGTVKPVALHREDLELDNEPTLFEEAFGKQGVSDDSDFADTDDEAEAEGNQPRIAKAKGEGSSAPATDEGKENSTTESDKAPEKKKDK
mmetsp:Transcript_19924/g.36993  ORF Transcript_19924/g.36993 Transcript_19924/m.36993 type:complete len:655 (+) Transcript_19924:225-2189(+)